MQQVIVADEQQGQATSIGQATFALAFIIGPAIASPLYFVVGPIVAVSINAASFLVSVLCLQAIKASKASLQPRSMKEGKGSAQGGIGAVMKEMLAGFQFVVKTRVLLIVNFIIAIPQGGIEVGFFPLLLGATPNALIGRVQSVIETAMYAMSLISIGLAGYFGQFVPVGIIFAVGGALLALSGVFGWFSLPRETTAQAQLSSD